MLPQGAILTRPSQTERRAEVAAVEAHLTELGIPIVGRIAAPGLLDANDVAIAPRPHLHRRPARRRRPARAAPTSWAASSSRRSSSGMGYRVVELAVANDVARLRNVFSIVAGDTVIAAPERVDLVAATDLKLVEVPRGEEMAAGVLAFGERRVIANLRFRESIALMRKAKLVVEVDRPVGVRQGRLRPALARARP